MEKLKKIFPLSVGVQTVRGGVGIILLCVFLDIIIELLLALLGYAGVNTMLLEFFIGAVHVYFLVAIVLVIAVLVERKNR